MPPLSVVVASAVPGGLEPCLDALLPQAEAHGLEVVVVDATGASPPEGGKLAWLACPVGTPTPDLWGRGLAAARSDRLAVLDTTAVPAPGWASAVMHSLTRGPGVVGGAVEPVPDAPWTDWVAYFSEYAQFMRPLPPGPASEVPGNNLAFGRDLLRIGSEYTTPSFWKTYWCGRLTEAGVPLRSDPELVVTNTKRYRLAGFLRRRYRHGRCFGGMRTRTASGTRRVFWALSSPLVPAVLFSRVVRRVWPKGRLRGRLLAALPGVALSALAWGLGEGVGYLAGPGATCADLA